MLALLLALPPAWGETLFYQPQSRDGRLSAGQWQALWQATRQAGVERLIVQWSRHGEEDFGGANGWLRASLGQASEAGLSLVLGLQHDPQYFARAADAEGLPFYWQRLFAGYRQQQVTLAAWQLPVAGWYLPAELDDRSLGSPALRAAFATQLRAFRQDQALPLHLSAFSAGRLSPAAYAHWLAGLQGPGIQLWWQDGAGTAALPASALARYRAELPCTVGLIHEAFRQTSAPGQPFSAEPSEPHADSGCHSRALFSLRYRPWASVLR